MTQITELTSQQAGSELANSNFLWLSSSIFSHGTEADIPGGGYTTRSQFPF